MNQRCVCLYIIDKQVTSRIGSLRSTLGRVKKEETKSGRAPVKMTARTAHICRRMKFLDGHMIPRNTKSSFTAGNPEEVILSP